MTKWEQFAKLKGIQKKGKNAMVFDEEKQEYLPRFGYKRANDSSKSWVIEHKEGQDADSKVDPFTRLEQEKKERVARNKQQQLHNLQRAAAPGERRLAGSVDLGAAKRVAANPDAPGKRNALGKRKVC